MTRDLASWRAQAPDAALALAFSYGPLFWLALGTSCVGTTGFIIAAILRIALASNAGQFSWH